MSSGLVPDIVTRPLYAFERFLFVGGRRPWNVLIAVRRPGSLHRASLAAALAALQRRHPMLRLGIVERGGRPVFTPHHAPIPVRVVDGLNSEAWFGEMMAELERPFGTEPGPLARLVWLRSSGSSDLILVCHHCICDGSSKLLLVRQLLQHLDRPGSGEHLQNDPFTLTDLFGERPAGRQKLPVIVSAAAARLFVDVSGQFASRSPPPLSPHYAFGWTIEGEAWRSLRESCRRQSVTPYTAIATALLRAVRLIEPRRRSRLLCPIGMRPFAPGLRPDMIFPFASNVTLSIAPALDRDFWSQARRLRADLTSRRARLDPKRLIWTAERLHDRCDRFIDLQLRGRPGSGLVFTHVGEADLPQRPAASTCLASFASTPWPSRLGISSFQTADRMVLYWVSREPLLARAAAERVRDEAAALLAAQVAAGR